MKHFTSDAKTGYEAKAEAQRIAFALIVFQACRVLRNAGILELVQRSGPQGVTLPEVVSKIALPRYGIKVLMESGEVDAVLIHGIMGTSFIRAMQKEAPEIMKGDPSQIDRVMTDMHSGLIELTQKAGYPIITSSFSDRTDEAVDYVVKNDVPLYPSPERAVDAIAAVMQYAEWRNARE